MPDLLHPAAPVLPCAPASPVPLPPPLVLSLPPLLVDVAEPDSPAVVGDRVPCHLFWAPLAAPLPPVLRPDRPYCPTAHAVQLGLLSPDAVGTEPPPTPSPAAGAIAAAALCTLLGVGLFLAHLLSTIPRP